MLSLETTLAERLHYEPQNVDPNELHDMALELEEWRKLADTPEDMEAQISELEAQISELEEWQEIRINGLRQPYKSAEHFEQAVGDYVEFFNDCVRTCEEYHGSMIGTAEPYNMHKHIAVEFEQRDEYKTALVNIRDAIKAGESLEYLASLLPDNLED